MPEFNVRKLDISEYNTWNELVDRSEQGCVFTKTFWLDAVGCRYYILGCFDKSQRLVGGMPIVESKKGYITMPPLTQTLGVIYDDFSKMKYVKKITKEKDIILSIVENMPEFTYFGYEFHYNFTNWMPFLWNKYSQNTRYTYVIEGLSDIEKIRGEFIDTTRSIINKAVKSDLRVVNDLSLKDMYAMATKTFEKQKMNVPYSFEWLQKFDEVLKANNARQMFFAVDGQNRLHAALYLVYDKNSAYYLIGGGDPEFRNSGAMYLNVFEAIKYSAQFTDKFDFEGSIIPQIEHMFRSFGAKQKQYFQITKNKSIILNIQQDIRKYGKIILKKY